MYLTFLWFNYVCFILIKNFMYFRGIMVISQWTRDQTARTVENLRRSIKGKMLLFTCTVLSILLFTTLVIQNDDVALTDDVAMTDEVSRFCWIKFLCTVDRWSDNMLVDQTILQTVHVYTQDYLQPNRMVKPCTVQTTGSNYVLLTDDVAQSWASKMFLIRRPWFT